MPRFIAKMHPNSIPGACPLVFSSVCLIDRLFVCVLDGVWHCAFLPGIWVFRRAAARTVFPKSSRWSCASHLQRSTHCHFGHTNLMLKNYTKKLFSSHRHEASESHKQKKILTTTWMAIELPVGWFGVALTAFITSTKLCYVEPGYYWDWWRPLACLPSGYLSRPLSLVNPP